MISGHDKFLTAVDYIRGMSSLSLNGSPGAPFQNEEIVPTEDCRML